MTPLVVICGPTASGKSSLAVATAQRLRATGRPAEIVNADSMSVYRGMDIGTAKPSVAERGGVPHHLIDIMDFDEEASVAEFQRLARDAIAQCRAREVIPLLVGGSSLYIRAIVDHFDFPGTDPDVRMRWEHELERLGSEALHRHLAQVAPEAAHGILPGNGRRIVRALEVIELTGEFHATLPGFTFALDDVVMFGLRVERDELDRRIERRVDAMWDAGFVEEVRGLDQLGLRDAKTSSRALGYRQVLEFLAGDCDETAAREATVAATRRFARKQLGWFRKDPRITWLDAADPANPLWIEEAI